MTNPTVGRIVLYVLQNGQKRAATVVNAWNGDRCNLTVHLDGANDLQVPRNMGDSLGMSMHDAANAIIPGMCQPDLIPLGGFALYPGFLCAASARLDESGTEPGTWHWPPRV